LGVQQLTIDDAIKANTKDEGVTLFDGKEGNEEGHDEQDEQEPDEIPTLDDFSNIK
jgi:hypothetical protein